MKALFIAVLTVASFNAASFTTELKGTPEELRKFLHPQKQTVKISASAQKRVYADQAIVSVLVKNDARTLAEAMQQNSNLRAKLKSRLVSEGVDAINIQNSQFSSSPQFGWFGDKPTSFEVNNRVAVVIGDEKALQALAAISDSYKEMSIAGTEYKHTQKDRMHTELKKEAMNKVLADKAYYESTLGVTLKTLSFSDSGLNIGATAGERAVEMIQVSGSRKRSDLSSLSYESARAPKTSFEEIEYNTTVSVQFEVIE